MKRVAGLGALGAVLVVASAFAAFHLSGLNNKPAPAAKPCVKPVALMPSDYQDVAYTVEQWAANELAKGVWKVKDPVNAVAVEMFADESKPGAVNADRVRLMVLIVDGPQYGLFGEIAGANAFREYRVTVARTCFGDGWRVVAAKHTGGRNSIESQNPAQTKGVIEGS